MKKGEIICWPESQDLFVLKGFKDNCRLVNGEKGIDTYGSSAYLVDTEWLKGAEPLADEPSEYDEFNNDLEMVYDDELEDLGLL